MSETEALKKVLVLYKFLPQWRKDFFNKLKKSLQLQGIEFDLIYGKLKNQDASKGDEIDFAWAKYLESSVIKFKNIELIWQPCLSELKKYDLIIVEQANKLLINYWLMIYRRFTSTKIAFWGHGINLMSHPDSLRNRFKKLFLRQCDWWFAYTESVKNTIRNSGVPADRITVVQNTIETSHLINEYQNLNEFEVSELRKKYGIGKGLTGIYCGGIYKEKKIDFLLEVCLKVRSLLPDFQLIVIGSGPQKDVVQSFANENGWCHYFGSKFDQERVPFFKMADVLLIPDAVGLVAIDSFAFETPIITTKGEYHGPEIEYIKNGINGVIVETNQPDSYATEITKTLIDRELLNKLKNGCRQSVEKYSLHKMVNNFIDGIKQCLEN